MFSLKNRIAIVTGGVGHLGSKITGVLAEYGAKVYVLDINENSKELISELFGEKLNIKYLKCDLSSKEGIEKSFNEIYQSENRIDILINNAFYGKGGELETITDENWLSGIEGTVTNYFRCIKETSKYMKESGGKIVNVASMYGVVSPDPSIYSDSGFNNPPNYGAGKAAVIQLTKYSAVHLAKYNIRVNAISPGPFPSPAVQKNEEFVKNLEAKVPMKRIGNPEDLMGVVLLLASDASSYITGQNILVDGGWTSW